MLRCPPDGALLAAEGALVLGAAGAAFDDPATGAGAGAAGRGAGVSSEDLLMIFSNTVVVGC